MRKREQANKRVVPHIDRNKCEGKGVCVGACPTAVFEMFILPKAQRQELTLKGKIKGFVHRWQQVEIVAPDQCQGCARCVAVCPEQAITLVRVG